MTSNQDALDFVRYRAQRQELIAMGIQIREFKPEFQAKNVGISRSTQVMLVDHETLYTGHFKLFADAKTSAPASAFIIKETAIVNSVATALESNFNSQQVWNPQTDQPDQKAEFGRKIVYRLLGWWQAFREE